MFWRNTGFIVMIISPISRIFLNYHTLQQIFFGFIVGIVWGVIFFMILVTLIYMDKGEFWNNRMIPLMKVLRGKDNIVSFRNVKEDLPIYKEEDQIRSSEQVMIFPLKDGVEKFIGINPEYEGYARVKAGSHDD